MDIPQFKIKNFIPDFEKEYLIINNNNITTSKLTYLMGLIIGYESRYDELLEYSKTEEFPV